MTVIIFFSQKEEVKKKRIDPIEKKILQVVSFNDVFLARANDASLPGIDNLFNLNRNWFQRQGVIHSPSRSFMKIFKLHQALYQLVL